MRLFGFALVFVVAGCNESPLVGANFDAHTSLDLALGASHDLAIDGVPTMFFGKFSVNEDCKPNAPADPVEFFTDIFFTNDTPLPMEPFHIVGGSFQGDNGQTLATFALDPVADFTVAAHGQVFLEVKKTPGSITPAKGCMTLPCSEKIGFIIDWGPAGVAPTQHSVSAPSSFFSCTR